jgi:hypothetical protein
MVVVSHTRCTAIALGLCIAAAPAHAQAPPDGYGIERFRLAMDHAGLIDVDSAEVPGHLEWSAGVWTGLAHDPLVLYTPGGTDGALVARRVTTGFVGAIGLGDRAELALALDVVDYQATTVAMTSLPTGGLGDLRVAGKIVVARGSWIDVAVVPAVTLPMGSARGYLRDIGPTFAPEIVLGARRDRVHGAVDLGLRLREHHDIAGLSIGNEALVRAGAGLALDDTAATELAISMSVATPLTDLHRNLVAAEALAGLARRITPELGLLVAGGLGLDNGFGTPDWRAVVALRFGAQAMAPAQPPPVIVHTPPPPPVDPDSDHDGVAGAADRCPDRAEDRNGFEDDDGCPDPTAQLTGRVADAEGLPIDHAAIAITDHAHPQLAPVEVAAGPDGRFTARVHPGALTVAVTAPGYQPGGAGATVAANASADVAVTLARVVRQGQLRGQVQSFEGKPLAATITVSGKAAATTQSDDTGMFSLDLPAGTFEVEIAAPGFTTQRRTVTVKLDGVTVLNADMRGSR